MVDLNQEAERVRARRKARLGAWAHLVHLSPEDMKAVLMEMLLEVDDGTIPNVSGVATPVPPPEKGTTNGVSLVLASQAVSDEERPSTSVLPAIDTEDDDADEDDDVHESALGDGDQPDDRSAGELARSVLRSSRKPLSASEIADAAGIASDHVQRSRLHQWLTRESKKDTSDLVRKGRKGSYKYLLRSPGEIASADYSVNNADTQKKLLTLLAAQPTADYGLLAKQIFGLEDGEPRAAIRNTIYYMRTLGKVRRRDDNAWEAV